MEAQPSGRRADKSQGEDFPFSWYERMRHEAPAHEDPRSGVLSVFRYDDVQRVLSDYEAFSSQRGRPDGSAASAESALDTSLISSDPPRHRQLRNLVTQAFTPRAVAQLAPRITAIIGELLDRVGGAGDGRMDFIEDFAYPLPVIVIAELLGIPAAERAQFKRWSDAIVSVPSSTPAGGQLNFMDAQREMALYFSRLMAERRTEPRDDLISHLITAEIGGQRLTEIELIGFCVLLLVAGNETTTNLLGNAILCFDEQPSAYERLRAQPNLIPSAIEEVLRYRSPVQSMFRTATGETAIGGVRTRAGQPVIAWIGSANRDEAQFSNAHVFDIERTPNRHLAFGHGIHFCLGAPLARLEAKLALGALTTRFRTIHRVPGAPLHWMESSIVYGVKALPITFTPE
ncbi:MAG TPA: cytochrome P450 [Ktedonobacterales bacterium]|nr:cytochrome P450 [Ktedonobacterales bacterium]